MRIDIYGIWTRGRANLRHAGYPDQWTLEL